MKHGVTLSIEDYARLAVKHAVFPTANRSRAERLRFPTRLGVTDADSLYKHTVAMLRDRQTLSLALDNGRYAFASNSRNTIVVINSKSPE
mgnify:CR=1 FL=1